jgi:hypothetical protein
MDDLQKYLKILSQAALSTQERSALLSLQKNLSKSSVRLSGAEVAIILREHGNALESLVECLRMSEGDLGEAVIRVVATFEVLCDLFGVPYEE